MNIREEIDAHSEPADRPVLHWLFSRYHMESQWQFVARSTYSRYGMLSYETHRGWEPTTEGRALYAALATPEERCQHKPSLTPQQYAAHGGEHCPMCESRDIGWRTEPEMIGMTAEQRAECNECGAQWDDLYRLDGYMRLRLKDGTYIPEQETTDE